MTLILPLVLLGLQVPAPKVNDDEPSRKRSSVEALLRGALKGVPRRIAVDVNLAAPIPEVPTVRWQAVPEFLKAFGSMLKREVVTLDSG